MFFDSKEIILVTSSKAENLVDLKNFLEGKGLILHVVENETARIEKFLKEKKNLLVLIHWDAKNNFDGLKWRRLIERFFSYRYVFWTEDFTPEFFHYVSACCRYEDFIVAGFHETEKIYAYILLIINRLLGSGSIAENERLKGVLGLNGYLRNFSENNLRQIIKVPVLFDEIAFFTTDILPNGRRIKPNYLWFKTIDHRVFYIKASLKKLGRYLPYYFQRISDHYIVNLDKPYFQGKMNSKTLMILNRSFKISQTYIFETNRKLETLYLDLK